MEQPESDTNVNRMSLRRRKEQSNGRKSRELGDSLKFLDDFVPESSNREKRKLKRKGNHATYKHVPYDEYGHIRYNGADACDCMQEECPGCWNECENCGSTRCGPQCRVNRKYYYESITFDGKGHTITNKHFPYK